MSDLSAAGCTTVQYSVNQCLDFTHVGGQAIGHTHASVDGLDAIHTTKATSSKLIGSQSHKAALFTTCRYAGHRMHMLPG